MSGSYHQYATPVADAIRPKAYMTTTTFKSYTPGMYSSATPDYVSPFTYLYLRDSSVRPFGERSKPPPKVPNIYGSGYYDAPGSVADLSSGPGELRLISELKRARPEAGLPFMSWRQYEQRKHGFGVGPELRLRVYAKP